MRDARFSDSHFRQLSLEFWQYRRSTWGSLLLLVLVSLCSSAFLVIEGLQRGELISALVARDSFRFGRSLSLFVMILAASAASLSLSLYLRDCLGLQWRRWLTDKILGRYLSGQTFYKISNPTVIKNATIDNPDQRIAEDIKVFTQVSLTVFLIFLDSIVQLLGFIGVLWFISKSLTFFLVIYAVLGSAIATFFFGKALVGINVVQLQREADFRFGLIRVRENAESVAFYQGQSQEKKQASSRFKGVCDNFNRFIRWQLGLDFFQNGYQYLTFILPSLILAPQILSGSLEVGSIAQSQAAFDRIWLSLSLVVIQFEQISALGASVQRLGGLAIALDASEQKKASKIENNPSDSLGSKQPQPEQSYIEIIEQERLGVEHLTLILPVTQSPPIEQFLQKFCFEICR
ncbi:MAG: hypothetical protein HC771_01975 [Synechococcales cyanobacterium CRU_2_2]|nr:hypothetical protein [Synechococcales cyanobacterium CRU_2_2]